MDRSIRFTEDDLAAIDGALGQLEVSLAKLQAIDGKQRRRLFKMGDKTEKFCREALIVLDKNRQLVPPAMDLSGAQASLATIDVLRPRAKQIMRLAERMQDTQLMLGADVATTARQGYQALREYGDAHGLEGMRQSLSTRFKRGRPKAVRTDNGEDQAA